MALACLKTRLPKAVPVLVAVYAGLVLLATALVWLSADRFWVGTLLAFAPRWPLCVPAAVLGALALRYRQRTWAGVALATCLWVFGPYMGFVVPVGSGQPAPAAGSKTLRVATYNAGGVHVADSALGDVLHSLDASVVGVSECSSDGERAEHHGFTVASVYGFCLFSKLSIVAVDHRPPNDAWEKNGSGVIVHYELDFEGRPVHVVGVHLETVRDGLVALRYGEVSELSANTELRDWESRIAREWTERADGPLIVLGDFNIPVESHIYDTHWSGFTNAFSACGLGYGHTKETRWYGIRIDHILMSDAWRCDDAEIGWGPSDHEPLVADLELLPE